MTTLLKPLKEGTAVDPAVGYTVVTCFIEFEGKFLALKRGRKDGQFGLWGIPGGKSEEKEQPRQALSREIFEETGVIVPESSYTFLQKAHSINPHDGSYLLYLYHCKLDSLPIVLINTKEHLDYQWVSPEEFEQMELLVSQRPAFLLVKDKVNDQLTKKVTS